ncbi:hypothetical protein [Demetria terragena]|uniref:hypothetical protein n=1 Tax=Demetria terragena TaxID=63959 RepID=UPI00036097B5|nr:hypothetical protein [Demetria terragena]
MNRREVLVFGAAGVGLAASAAGGTWLRQRSRTEVDLHAHTVAYATEDKRVLVTDPALLEADSRVAEGPTTERPRERMTAFLKAAEPWLDTVPGRYVDLARNALLDLWILSDDLPAAVAGWSPPWRYVWPRDASFCAAALARVGHLDLAVGQLRYLQQVQLSDGWFEARYVPGTADPPDGRERQFDGTGLVTWAIADVRRSARRYKRDIDDQLQPLLNRSFQALSKATDGGRALPAASPDFWEVPETRTTIGVAACTLGGLVAGGELLGQPEPGQRLASVIRGSFGANGFQRYTSHGGPDGGSAFFDALGVRGLMTSGQLRSVRRALLKPAGGISPGASWKRDGISWTPATSLLGLAMARAGDHQGAREILDWIDDHRTECGSIPEKVVYDGSPAAEAPLVWSDANVLLTLDVLARS